jgi:hypothetical protein
MSLKIYQLVTLRSPGRRRFKPKSFENHEIIDIDDCSSYKRVFYVSKDCGVRFAKHITAGNSFFSKLHFVINIRNKQQLVTMETMMEKKVRKRMIFMESERNRKLNAQCSAIQFSPKSFDEIKEEREAVAVSSYADDNERDEEDCNISIVSDCVSELRRRRVYYQHHKREYPTKSIKKKPKFWEPEEVPGPAVMLSPSRGNRYASSTSDRMKSYASSSSSLYQESSSKIATPRVLWKDQTTNLKHDFEALLMNNNNNNSNNHGDQERNNDGYTTSDEIMEYDDDEIMTPIKITRNPIDYNDDEDMEENEGYICSPTSNQTGGPYPPADAVAATITPARHIKSNEATVNEIQTATQALAAFVTSAACVMKEAKTPGGDEMGSSSKINPLVSIRRKIQVSKEEPETPTYTMGKVKQSVSFTPIKEEECPTTTHHYVFQGEATPLKSINEEESRSNMILTTKRKEMDTTPSTMATITTPMTMDNSLDEADIMISANRGAVVNFVGDVTSDDVVVETLESDVLWPSLFGENFAGGVDDSTKTMLEALVEGGALQREANGMNILKLFVDMYHRHTFEKIVQSIKSLKGLQAFVICRGLDPLRPTYRSVQEMKSLLNATGSVDEMDSLMLLNFNSDSLTDVAMMIHQQPSLYRIQIQLADGTLNGEILGAIATAPRLTHVMLELKESCSFGTLMNSKTIQSVRVNSKDLVLKKNHVRTLIYSLQSNFTLTSLDIAAPISLEDFRSLCTTLKQNYRLESLRLNLDLKTKDESGIAALELANLFRENNMLINIWNYSYQSSCPVSDTSMCIVNSALRYNKAMVNFKFFSEDIDGWKKKKGGNPEWMTDPNVFNANGMVDGPETVRMKQCDGSVSILSGGTNSVRQTTVETKSLFEDEISAFVNMLDDDTFSIPCDCVNMANIENIGADFHKWVFPTKKESRRMEL